MDPAAPATTLRIRPGWPGGSPVRLGEDVVSIGRHPSNTFPIRDDRASRKHCVIEPDGSGGYLCRDLASRNGTRLNGERITAAQVRHGDVIAIGNLEFYVEQASGEPAVVRREKPAKRRREAAEPAPPSPGDTKGARADSPDSSADPDAEPSPDGAWADDLLRVFRGIPPKDEPLPDVRLIQADGTTSDALTQPGAGPRAVLLLLQLASKARATDIHVEPKAEHTSVRMRVDGQMVWIADLPKPVAERVGGLIKAASQMRSAASDAVLDGHVSARFPDRRVEFRVSFTPSMHGQKLVVRVLDMRDVPHSLKELGLLPWMDDRVRKVCEKDSGLLLTVGPTGSGKTTTLYNALRAVDRERRNVITIEDPVEYQLEGVTQIPINDKKGNSFGSLLRSVLRQDPDVILVGEIRDEETARTAMQAAMTGHVVFSTLHAKDSTSAVFRLLDLGIEPYLVANALDLVLAQRLVRVLCDACKRDVPIKPGEATRIGAYLAGKTVTYTPVGCAACLKTGHRGRRALFELLDVTDELRDVILTQPNMAAMKRVISHGHFTTLAQFGWRLAAQGLVALDEVERVAGST